MKKILFTALILALIITAMSTVAFAAIGDVLGYAKYTDIAAYVNNYPITSYNINDYTTVVVEDLRYYGFDVTWSNETRTLTVERNGQTKINGKEGVYKYSSLAGQNSFPYIETDIVTYVNGQPVTSYNIGGQTCIYIDALRTYGGTEWLPDIRAIKLWVNGVESKGASIIPEVPTTKMYASDGREIIVESTKVDEYSAVGWSTEPFLIMTNSERSNASGVRWIHQRSVSYYENEQLHRLFFGFKNKNDVEMYAPAKVYIKIINSNNEVVYDAVRTVKYSDFGNWTQYGKSHYQADVEILTKDIKPGTSTNGKLYFTVTNPGYFDFDEYILSIYDLPKIIYSDMCSLALPATPKVLHDYGYDKKIDCSYNITNIRYKFEDSYDNEVKLTLYFDGEKYYDSNGAGQSSTCRVSWKLYDLQGYVITDGTFYSPALCMGEKFRNEEELIYDLKPGEYRLEILSTNER